MRRKKIITNHRTIIWVVASVSAIGLTYVATAEDTSPSPKTPTLSATAIPTAPVVTPEESEPLPANDVESQAEVSEENAASLTEETVKPLQKLLGKPLLVAPKQLLDELFETENLVQLDDEVSSGLASRPRYRSGLGRAR